MRRERPVGWARSPGTRDLHSALARGDIDRPAMLDACLSRLQRGGRAMDTQDVVAVHDDLSPTLDEVAERRRDYLALLPPGSRSPVALMAQRELGRLHEAGRLDAAELVEQSRSLLLRTEKKLLRDHLALLKAHAAARPADIDAVVEALSSGFANGASDIQRAVCRPRRRPPAEASREQSTPCSPPRPGCRATSRTASAPASDWSATPACARDARRRPGCARARTRARRSTPRGGSRRAARAHPHRGQRPDRPRGRARRRGASRGSRHTTATTCVVPPHP